MSEVLGEHPAITEERNNLTKTLEILKHATKVLQRDPDITNVIALDDKLERDLREESKEASASRPQTASSSIRDDRSERSDRSGRPETAPKHDMSGRHYMGGRPDMDGRPDMSSRPDMGGRPEMGRGQDPRQQNFLPPGAEGEPYDRSKRETLNPFANKKGNPHDLRHTRAPPKNAPLGNLFGDFQ
mmetsp:Transcript_33774/g.38909  ORF Transcript_33774/g.38909 Transcript_33774/m.38909 type:complete len:186 (+) Transcript_33774:1738-2295(+)